MDNGDNSAYPQNMDSQTFECATGICDTSRAIEFGLGLTKREAFAMAAMQGMSSHSDFYGQSKSFAEDIARDSVKFADALLKELEK